MQQGVIGELRVVGDPRVAERHCEEDEDDSDMVSDSQSRVKMSDCVPLKCCSVTAEEQKDCLLEI